MKQFVIKILILASVSIAIVGAIVTYKIQNYSDINYYKFTSKHKSLITGSSRAKYCIDPIQFPKETDLLNFAFSVATSPYGEIYYNAIEKKITKEKGGIFILDVDPYALSIEEKMGATHLIEKENKLGRQFFLNADPNYEYIFKNLTPLYYHLITESKTNSTPQSNGFIILSNKNYSLKKELFMRKKKLIEYRKNSQNFHPSAYRIEYLEKTIDLLQKYGDVYLVSVPVSNEIYKIQKAYWPEHEGLMDSIAKKHHIHYIMLQKNFPNPHTLDEIHVLNSDAEIISAFLYKKISSLKK